MIVRLANVIFWFATICAAVVAAFAVFDFLTFPVGVDPWEITTIRVAFVALLYGTGWAIRYVLSGKRGLL